MIAENLTNINNQLQLACKSSQRSVADVTMIGVTKSVGIEEAAELVQLGVQNLAENRVDKLLQKKAGLEKFNDIQWHLIGNLQRRKVKLIIIPHPSSDWGRSRPRRPHRQRECRSPSAQPSGRETLRHSGAGPPGRRGRRQA